MKSLEDKGLKLDPTRNLYTPSLLHVNWFLGALSCILSQLFFSYAPTTYTY